MAKFKSIEVCAGAGGQAIGLELAGFEHVALVDNDPHACETLRLNRPNWLVIEQDLRKFSGRVFRDIDLLAGGVPCPPFSKAGKQQGRDDERDLFPEMIRLAKEIRPKAILIENVRGLLDPIFNDYRRQIELSFKRLGYIAQWKLLQASDFGVPQLRPRVAMVAFRPEYLPYFKWPTPKPESAPTVGEALFKEMVSRGWKGAVEWRNKANKIAPTLVGGSKKHGGPDLGPTRARKAWADLGVNGKSLADEAPNASFSGQPRLTVKMAAIIQGFPSHWKFFGKKTASYRQVGNAFPAPVACALGKAIRRAFELEAAASLKKNSGRSSRFPESAAG